MSEDKVKKPVQRSRLMLLAGLSASAAGGGCAAGSARGTGGPSDSVTKRGGGQTFGNQANPFEKPGGEGPGGGGGGGGHGH